VHAGGAHVRDAAALIRALLAIVALLLQSPTYATSTRIGRDDWPTYGRSERHDFVGSTTLDRTGVKTLAPRWYFPTGEVVSAQPVVVARTVYVGSWDGFFYAIDARTGAVRWKYRVKDQAAIVPQPGNRRPQDVTGDGGIITSSAYFLPGTRSRPDLVIFGGGYTLYALRAYDGRPFWTHDFTGRPERAPDPAHDPSRIFSSPVVVGNRVLFAVTPDGAAGYRGYAAAADVTTGRLLWRFETDRDARGRLRNDGCGGVWSSPTVIHRYGLAVYDVADCHFHNAFPMDEKVFALRIADGRRVWTFDPRRPDDGCDFDFGGTANTGRGFLGVGGKDGTYYSIDPRNGHLRWKRNVVFGGFSGGFIATTAYDGSRVYGATAIGDFGRFEGAGDLGCDPGNPSDLPAQEPSLHAFDARSGAIAWQSTTTPSLGPTSVAGGMTFVCANLTPQNPSQRIDVRDSRTGVPVAELPLPVGCTSGVVPAGNTLFIGTGTSEQPQPAGVWAYTPSAGPVELR
jgi:polyvinyl alcohol dehydrogenase (cytochrome)